MQKYFGLFSSRDNVAAEFNAGTGSRWDDDFVPADDFPTDDEILLAWYEYENCSGDAFVIFERDGKVFEVNGGHCSCYGLEDQWAPEETSWAALAKKDFYRQPTEMNEALAALVARRA